MTRTAGQFPTEGVSQSLLDQIHPLLHNLATTLETVNVHSRRQISAIPLNGMPPGRQRSIHQLRHRLPEGIEYGQTNRSGCFELETDVRGRVERVGVILQRSRELRLGICARTGPWPR